VSKNIAVKAATAAHLRLTGWKDSVAARVGDRADRGQTSVEYLGIIAVVVLIVAAILGTNIGQTIYNAITAQIAKVAK
jgi:pilus assembly protein Flp/PilA